MYRNWNNLVTKIICDHVKQCSYHKWYWKLDVKASNAIWFNIILHVIHMSFICTRTTLICYLYILVCHPYVTCMCSYVIRMSLVCTRMSSVCHWYVLVCHQYVTRTSRVCTRVSLYVTRMYWYVICMSLVCGFTMNLSC